MKQIFTILILLISFTKVSAQKYSPVLEQIDVINNFKFGKQKYLFFNNLEYVMVFQAKSDDKLDKFVYQYLGNNPNNLFGVYWDSVHLMFSRGVLVDFEIEWKTTIGFEKVLKNLTSIYGETLPIRTGDSRFQYAWQSNNIEMSLVKQEQTNKRDESFSIRVRNFGLIKELSRKQ